MKPFILFGGHAAPKGGGLDFLSAWTSVDEVEAEAARLGLKWYQVAVFMRDGEMTVVGKPESPKGHAPGEKADEMAKAKS